MKFAAHVNPATLERTYTLTVSDAEIAKAYDRLPRAERLTAMPYFGREDATIEERLMGLQLIARVVEEAA